jgi:hypothetical protein
MRATRAAALPLLGLVLATGVLCGGGAAGVPAASAAPSDIAAPRLPVFVEKMILALTDPSQPPLVKVRLRSGTLTVEAYGGREVVVTAEETGDPGEAGSHAPRERHRSGIRYDQDNNVVQVMALLPHPVSLRIQVPMHSNLQLRGIECQIRVAGVAGEIELDDVTGSIEARELAGSVVANAVSGNVTVALKRVDADKPMAFTTFSGSLDVTLPADIRANVDLQSTYGTARSEFELQGAQPADAVRPRAAGWLIKPRQMVRGTFNGGGPEVSFKTFAGEILIHRAPPS